MLNSIFRFAVALAIGAPILAYATAVPAIQVLAIKAPTQDRLLQTLLVNEKAYLDFAELKY